MTRIRDTRIDRCAFARFAPTPRPIVLAIALSLTACTLVGAPTVLTEQAKSARTSERHLAVAGRYREYAAHLRAEAARHDARLVGLEASGQLDEARHCRELAEDLSRAAAAADAIAQDQEASGKASRELE